MDDDELDSFTSPSSDNLETMSATEREAFADAMRDEWDQDCYLVA